MKAITLVFSSFSDSFKVIKDAGLRKFYFLPGIISMFLFGGFIYLGEYLSLNLASALENFFKLQEYGSILYIFIKILVWICTVFFYYLVYKSLLLVIISPILGYVSERVETHLTGKKFDFTFKDNLRFLIRGIDIGLKSFFKQMVGTCVVMLLGFIFPINLSIPLLIFIIQGYFTGFSFMDYTLERYNLSPKESLDFLKKQRVYAALCGGIFTLLFFIPVVGIFIAPLITCVATTMITLELLKEHSKV
ncbi:EI24 domain-containing protein [Fusobacterium mortiferum]|uniref:EI24 domain-containing protein n=1 Tax=Fusobacterium mortiferum TaxID=850 RepID=A0ABS2G118_FUSMR|nr:EI24 domain-containing protein [Fusobacterium mortiferum]MBM6821809.1 EI24 domain-containing protein [Fusobacterium mortiferum]MBM6875101.1 EI24 domain-containing protein [Fusobacterium mortiferum]